MRVCVRVVLLAGLAGISLAGCDTVDSLRETTNALLLSGKRPVALDNVSLENRMVEPEPAPIEEETTAPKKKQQRSERRLKFSQSNGSRRAPKKPSPAQAAPSSAAEPQNAPSQAPPAPNQLKTLWPEAPASETFSR